MASVDGEAAALIAEDRSSWTSPSDPMVSQEGLPDPGSRVVVAMSGGVDSSVAAALAVNRGCEVVGVMLRLWSEKTTPDCVHNLCCTPDAVEAARSVAQLLGFPLYELNAQALFKQRVVDTFVSEYLNGRTPNPCIVCNRYVRFGYLLQHARALQADFLLTGHYARVETARSDEARFRLLRGTDRSKDQSYVLYSLHQDQLGSVRFPLGHRSKSEVRSLARSLRLPVADRPESQDLCFAGGRDYRDFLMRHAPEAMCPGPIVDQSGRRVGTHRGLALYTIGQRKGLGISAGEPMFVLSIDAEHNTLTVGPESARGRQELCADEVTFVSGRWPASALRAQVQVRYRATAHFATVQPLERGQVGVMFDAPIRGVAPGQAAVFYQDDVCFGGGTIS